MTQWLPSWRAVVASMPGSDPAPSGSVIEKQERISPAASGRSHCSFCASLATTSSRCMLPSSGAAQLSACGPSSEYPAASNTTAIERMSSPRPPHSSPTCGESSPASFAFVHQLALERVVEPVPALARVSLEGDDHVADEGLGARLERFELGGEAEVDHGSVPGWCGVGPAANLSSEASRNSVCLRSLRSRRPGSRGSLRCVAQWRE